MDFYDRQAIKVETMGNLIKNIAFHQNMKLCSSIHHVTPLAEGDSILSNPPPSKHPCNPPSPRVVLLSIEFFSAELLQDY